jgi:hypothetical protein
LMPATEAPGSRIQASPLHNCRSHGGPKRAQLPPPAAVVGPPLHPQPSCKPPSERPEDGKPASSAGHPSFTRRVAWRPAKRTRCVPFPRLPRPASRDSPPRLIPLLPLQHTHTHTYTLVLSNKPGCPAPDLEKRDEVRMCAATRRSRRSCHLGCAAPRYRCS